MAIIEVENFIFCAIIMAGVDTQKIDFLKAQKVNLEKNLKDTRDKLFSTQDTLNAAQSKLDSDKKENQEKIKELVDSLLGEMENLKSTIADYEAQIAKTNQEIDDLKDSIKKLNEQAQSVEGVTIPPTRISSAIGERSSDQIQVESQKETEQKQEITQEVKTTSVPTQPETTSIQSDVTSTQPEVASTQSDVTSTQQEVASTQQEVASTQPEAILTQPEAILTQSETTSAQTENLSEDQKARQLRDLLNSLSADLETQNPQNGRVLLSLSQLQAIEKINQLRLSSLRQEEISDFSLVEGDLSRSDKRYLWKQQRKALNKDTKEAKKDKKQLKKLAEARARNLNEKNQVNYEAGRVAFMEMLNSSFFERGGYTDEHLAFAPKNTNLIIELCKNADKLRNPWVFNIITPNHQEILVQTEQFSSWFQGWVERLATCSNKKTPWIVDWITNNTKMNKNQASSAVGILWVAASVAAIVGIGRWLFTKKDKEGNRSFDFSLGRIWTLAAGLFWITVGSQALTGKWPMDLLNTLLTTGKTPRNEETYKSLDPEEQLWVKQSGLQFALLWVPYSELAQYSSPKTWTVETIDLQALRSFHQNRLLLAQQANDTQQVTTINGQISTIDELLRSQTGRDMINTGLLNLNLNAADLHNPNNANLTLDARLEMAAKNRQEWERFKAQNKLRIASGKEVEFEKRMNAKELSESDFRSMQTEGILFVETKESKALDALNLSLAEKQEILGAYDEFRWSAENIGLTLEAQSDGKIKLGSHGKELLFDPKMKTIPWLKDASGRDIPFESLKEAMQTILFVNKLKADLWSEVPDYTKKAQENRPFALAEGVSQVWKWIESLVFNKHDWQKVVMSNLLPIISTMDRKFPTIEAGDNRKFFVHYLNTLWKNEHQK